MEAYFLDEPELEFGAKGLHIDVRFGLMNHGVLDYGDSGADSIKIGFVGTNETIDGLRNWLDKCESGIDEDPKRRYHMAPRFPGFCTSHTFYSQMVFNSKFEKILTQREIESLVRIKDSGEAAMTAAQLFDEQIRQLKEETKVDIVLCAPPLVLAEKTLNDREGEDPRSFRDALKAAAMGHQTPTQIVLPPTYDSKKKILRVTKDTERRLQDEATVAWNFFTALYYKAGGIPWRMKRLSSDYPTCFVGVAFFEDLDKKGLHTSLAQVFNERGEGVVVRGAAASLSKDDRRPYLEPNDAFELLAAAIERYRGTHKNLPARLVLHKTSPFKGPELEGFQRAVDNAQISYFDALTISTSSARLMRDADYPPLRGSMLQMSEQDAILYTKGSVEFFKTYPGSYVPVPLNIRSYTPEISFQRIGNEIMGLSKMNWNQTQFDGRLPITIGAARQVAKVLRYLPEDRAAEASYRFYM